MNTDDKQFARRAIHDFMYAVASMVGDDSGEREFIVSQFPEPTGLGTDGTCWSDEQHREFALAAMKKAGEFLRRANRT